MSVEKANEFLLALKEKGADEAWAAKAAEAKTEEEKFALAADMAKEMGYDLTAEDVREALTGLGKAENDLVKLDDDAVENVAGGGIEGLEPRSKVMRCFACHKDTAEYTGVSENVFWFIVRHQYRCTECGTIYWEF